MLRNLVLVALAAPWACLACDPRVCRDTGPATHALPERLSETGLFADFQSETLAARVYPYAPAFALWSDGAEKRRFIFVPEGERVDTSELDDWRFPEGAKLWKEFSRDGVRVETRLLQKLGPAETDWAAVAYLWRADHSDAERVPYGAINALGGEHDVPAAGECAACHDGRRSRVLGFSAIQLALAGAAGEPGLSEAAQNELLSQNLPSGLELPGTPRERAALGYLHANCSHCHNQSGAGADADKCLDPAGSVDLDFSLRTDELSSTAKTATYRTAIGTVVKPGNPDDSKLLELVSKRGAFRQMPPIGTERVDSNEVRALRDWIGHL